MSKIDWYPGGTSTSASTNSNYYNNNITKNYIKEIERAKNDISYFVKQFYPDTFSKEIIEKLRCISTCSSEDVIIDEAPIEEIDDAKPQKEKLQFFDIKDLDI